MSDDTKDTVAIVFLLIVGLLIGTMTGIFGMRRSAISANVAHYEVDNHGNVTFVWNTQEEK